MAKKKFKLHKWIIISLIYILSSIYLIHSILLFNKIENLIRYIIIGIISLSGLLLLIKIIFGKKKKHHYVLSTILILFSVLFIFLGFNLNKIYSYFADLNKDVVYSTSLVTLKETKDTDMKVLKGAKFGLISDANSVDGYVMAQEIIKKEEYSSKNKIVYYNGYHELILALYNKEVDYIFLPTNYVDVFGTNEGFEDIGEKLRTITTSEKEASKKEIELSGSSKDVNEPFTILLIGVDSTTDGLQNADSFNGDSLMLVTFNPKTMTATMLSIPRDSYVPIACFKDQYRNKITHSAAHGTSCVINTIQNFLDIKIDYYMKINFTGVVDLVNTLGGIEVDVPYNLCEQNSKREFGDKMVYIRAGHQTLDGEQALAFSRNRKKNEDFCSSEWTEGYRDDFVRAANQQVVVQAMLDKMKSFTSISNLEDLLKVISKNIDTNMSQETMFSFYNLAKDVLLSSSSTNVISIQKLFLEGDGQTIYDETSKLNMWNYILNDKSVNEVKKAMNVNLGLDKYEEIKTFSYSMNEEYTPKVIGKGNYDTPLYDLVYQLTGETIEDCQEWAQKRNLTLDIQYVQDSTKKNGIVTSQEYPVLKRIDLIPNRTMKVTVVKNSDGKVDCVETPENKACKIPDFKSKTKSDVINWANKFSNTINIDFKEIESDEKEGTIIEQSITNKTVKDLIEDELTLKISIAKEKDNDDSDKDDSDDSKSDDSSDDDEKE